MGPGEERGYCLGEGYQRGLLFSTSDSLLRPLICYDLVELFLSCIFSGGNPNYFLLLRHCQAGCNCNPESALMVTMPRNIIWPWQKSTSTLPSSRTINIRLKLRIITDSLKCITTETSEQCFVFFKKNNTVSSETKQSNPSTDTGSLPIWFYSKRSCSCWHFTFNCASFQEHNPRPLFLELNPYHSPWQSNKCLPRHISQGFVLSFPRNLLWPDQLNALCHLLFPETV